MPIVPYRNQMVLSAGALMSGMSFLRYENEVLYSQRLTVVVENLGVTKK